MKMIDCGASTGLVTLPLQPEVGEIAAADSSEGMLGAVSAKTALAGLTHVRPLKLDLETQASPESDFDLIVSSMTSQDLENPQLVLSKLALAPGRHHRRRRP
jgi:ubiquinone/menaquinone biosynthesis C-methylase UbiE